MHRVSWMGTGPMKESTNVRSFSSDPGNDSNRDPSSIETVRSLSEGKGKNLANERRLKGGKRDRRRKDADGKEEKLWQSSTLHLELIGKGSAPFRFGISHSLPSRTPQMPPLCSSPSLPSLNPMKIEADNLILPHLTCKHFRSSPSHKCPPRCLLQ
mmetsp:Transcript_32987/g.65321  ORF Transcript_32987/g.65321 Transcript_32987/m.65321 type:complete len:156 (-) Transcript_32987:689-1156(-)